MKLGRENKNTHFKKKKNDGRVGRGDGAPFLASVRPAFDTQDSNTDILSSTFSICESPQRAPEETTLSHADFTVSVIPASRGAPSSALAPRREPRRRVLPLPEAARLCLRRRERRRARPPRPGGRRRGERRGARAAARSGLAAAGRLRCHRRHRRRCASVPLGRRRAPRGGGVCAGPGPRPGRAGARADPVGGLPARRAWRAGRPEGSRRRRRRCRFGASEPLRSASSRCSGFPPSFGRGLALQGHQHEPGAAQGAEAQEVVVEEARRALPRGVWARAARGGCRGAPLRPLWSSLAVSFLAVSSRLFFRLFFFRFASSSRRRRGSSP